MKNISPPYKFSLKGFKGGGWDEQRQPKTQPSAEIVRVECAKRRRECDLSVARATLCGDRARRVREMQARVRFVPCARKPLECAKCRRECDLSRARATLCGDRAGRVREMQARVRFAPCARNSLRRSCVSSARNAGESAICPMRAQHSCGDRAVRVSEMQARVRFVPCARNLRRSCVSSARRATVPCARVSGELEDENRRVASTTLVRGAICGAGS